MRLTYVITWNENITNEMKIHDADHNDDVEMIIIYKTNFL